MSLFACSLAKGEVQCVDDDEECSSCEEEFCIRHVERDRRVLMLALIKD